MKKKIQSVICILLTVVLCFSSASIAFAKENVTPVILVHGLGASAVYENAGTENQTEIQNLGLGDIASGIFSNTDIIFEVLKMLDPARKTNADTFINSLANLVSSSNLNCTKDGNVKKGQGIANYWTDSLNNHKEYWQDAYSAEPGIARQLCKSVGAKNVYLFAYDWRQDICATAKNLNSYIKSVKKQTGAKKVTLVGCSLGGSVLSAYIDAYKNNKELDRCIFVNPAFQGVDVARAYALDITFKKQDIMNYIKCMESAFDNGSKKSLFKFLGAAFDVRIGYACDYLNGFVKNKSKVKKLYNKVLKPWIGNIPALWECIPYDSFDKAVKEMSKIGFLDKKSGVYKKIKKYHGVQGRLSKNLKAIKKQGVQVAVIANYGQMGIPLTSKAANQTDSLIDTKYASGGATTAKYGKKLKAKGKYVSADKAINAKTCILPDNTWFIRNLGHVDFIFATQATVFVANLATGKVKCNLKAVEKKYKYKQFVHSDSKQNLKNI